MAPTDDTYEGRPCKLGHTARYTNSRGCVACTRERAKQRAAQKPEETAETKKRWKRKNREKVKIQSRRYNVRRYWSDPEAARARAREERAKDREKANTKVRNWREQNQDYLRLSRQGDYQWNIEDRRAEARARKKANPEANRKNENIRRGRKSGAEGAYTQAHMAAILAAQGGVCSYCDSAEKLQHDHIIPLARGGSNWPWNMQWLCPKHNVSKNDRTDSEYRAIMGLPKDEPVIITLVKFAVILV